MKVLFDTCVVIDIFGKSNHFFDSYCAYDVALLRSFDPCLSVSSTTDICYLLHARGFADKENANELTKNCLDLFDLIENTEQDCKAACKSTMTDYEDALIAASAYRAGIDLIITRNKKDFADSPVAAMSPTEFVKLYKPTDVTYAESDFDW